MIELSLKDKISLFEYGEQTVLRHINHDAHAVLLEVKSRTIRLDPEAKEYLKERMQIRLKQDVPEYVVADRIMAAAYNSSRTILQV